MPGASAVSFESTAVEFAGFTGTVPRVVVAPLKVSVKTTLLEGVLPPTPLTVAVKVIGCVTWAEAALEVRLVVAVARPIVSVVELFEGRFEVSPE